MRLNKIQMNNGNTLEMGCVVYRILFWDIPEQNLGIFAHGRREP